MKYLSHYTEQATSKALEKNKAFFAFSQKQFNEKREPGIKYVSLKQGLICPADNVAALLIELDSALENGIKADFEDNGFKKIVRREYFNYETQITMDNKGVVAVLSDYVRMFPEIFTVDAILKVCRDCFNEAVEQDMF